MSVFIPTQDEMKNELLTITSGLFRQIVKNCRGKQNLYDLRATRRVRRCLLPYTKHNGKVAMALSYGGIKEISEYAYDVSRFFELSANQELMREISDVLVTFCEWYEPFIL